MLWTGFKNQEPRKLIESYTKVKLGQRQHFSDFFQRLTKAVQKGVTDPDARQLK